ALLETGALPARSPQDEPGPWMVQEEWRVLLEDALDAGRGDHWLSWLHLGVMRLEAFDRPGAREAWMCSIAHAPSAWAFRNLSVLEGHPEEAIHLMQQAWEIGPAIPALAIEYAHLLLKAGHHDELTAFIERAPAAIREHERILLIAAHSALETGRWQDVEPLFDREFATIQEGEVTLTNLWFRFHEQMTAAAEGCPIDDELRARIRKDYPPPSHIDFRA
nr:tetratricopeptide repeat protein [Armatimonadota bacterium]